MSSKEPVSAYGIFKAAKNLANSNKKYSKKQNGSANSNINKRGKIVKLSSSVTAVGKLNSSKMGRRKRKKQQKKKANKDKFTKETPPVVVKKLMTRAEQRRQVQLGLVALEKNREQTSRTLDPISEVSEDTVESDMSLSDDQSLKEEENTITIAPSQVQQLLHHLYMLGDHRVPPVTLPEIIVHESCAEKEGESEKRGRRRPTATRKPTLADMQDFKKSKTSLDLPLHTDTTSDVFSSEDSEQPSTSKAAMEKAAQAETTADTLNVPKSDAKNSFDLAKEALELLFTPLDIKTFFEQYWEQKHHWISRQNNPIYSHLISFEDIDNLMLTNNVEFGTDIDVVIYRDGKRKTVNPVGRALSPVVWDFYKQGHSIRLLNPSKYFQPIYSLCSKLQEHFHCFVGANVYLTPPNSQGFAPHHDDIEAFVVQVEGRKNWRLYKPVNGYILPRYSSKNLKQEDIGESIFNEVLCPGDMLYFPRGTVHQASTEPGYHSLHITFSVYQKQSYADLLEIMVPKMLEHSITNLDYFRKGLPIGAFRYAGFAFSDKTTKERTDFIEHVTLLIKDALINTPLASIMDSAMDEMAKKYQRQALPPSFRITKGRGRSLFGCRARINERGECFWNYAIGRRSRIRLLRANILRLVREEGETRVYFYLDNSRTCSDAEPNYVQVEESLVDCVKALLKYYPKYVRVYRLPASDDETRIDFAEYLWNKGLLMVKEFSDVTPAT